MNKKKIMRIVATVMACASIGAVSAFGVSGCIKKDDTPEPSIQNVAVESVGLNKSELSLKEGESEILKATITPGGATNKHVTWTSSDPAVATVDSGLVTAVKAGKATITVTTADGGKTATCEVTVAATPAPQTVAVTGVTLDKTTVALKMGETTTATLTETVAPTNATNKNVTWTSSDTKIATVKDGVVTAVGAGTATITVTTEDENKTATCEVTVAAADISVTGVTLDKATVSLQMGGTTTEKLTATVAPTNATNKKVTWTSSDETIVTVDQQGNVKALKDGKVTITVTTEDGNHSATCEVTVAAQGEKPEVINVTGVTLDQTTATLKIGGTDHVTLKPTVAPAEATNKNVSWKSSNEAIATVKNGVVTAVAAGKVNITVTTEDGSKTATCEVTVEEADPVITGVTIKSSGGTSVAAGGELELTATVAGEGNFSAAVTWKIKEGATATDTTLTEGGYLKAGNVAGKLTVVATSVANTAIYGELEITVTPADIEVTGVTLDKNGASLNIGATTTLTATITPEDATNKNVTWKSSNEAIATVKDGVVTAVAEGKATITVTTVDGNHSATCEVTVAKADVAVTGVTLDQTTVALKIGGTTTATLKATVEPADATNKNVTWKSSNEAIATVKDGVVTAVAEGKATITVTTEDGNHSATCEVTVAKADDPQPGDYTPDGVYTLDIAGKADSTIFTSKIVGTDSGYNDGYFKLSSSKSNADYLYINMNLPKNKIIKIRGTGHTSNTTDSTKNVTISTELKSGSVGTVTGLPATFKVSQSEGPKNFEQTLTVSAEGEIVLQLSRTEGNTGCEYTEFVVEIKSAEPVNVQSVSVKEATALTVGGTEKLTATVSPANADNTAVTWESSDPAVATVDQEGNVTAVAKGTANITVTSKADATKTATCVVTVTNVMPTAISLGKTEATTAVGKFITLTATVSPENTTVKTVTWSSSDDSIATVDNNGKVTGVKEGNVVITATSTEDASVKATITVHVLAEIVEVTGVTLNSTTATINMETDTKLQLTADVKPANATNKTVVWSSSNTALATVDSNGLVTARKGGTVTITATTEDGGFEAVCAVTIEAPKPVAGAPVITKASLDEFETAYVEWTAENCKADWFNVYYAADNDGNWKKLDGPLVRQYADYYRADMVGLKAGTYKMKVVPVVGNDEVAEVAAIENNISVKAHERTGYAFINNKVPGAYNLDGTLKEGAKVIYVTAETAKTVTCTVNKKGKPVECTGFQSIIDERQGSGDTTPLCFRIIGTVTKDDLDHISSSSEGLQIKQTSNITIEGIGNDATIYGFGMLLRAVTESEVRNLGVMYFMDDGISIDTDNEYLWVHNNDIFYGQPGSASDQVKGDGSLDTKGSNYMTHSYNHFWDSGKCNLQGMKSEDPSYRMTYHHNWYDHSDSRHPRIRTSTVHIYNNYFDGNSKYGVGVTTGASAFVENNYFRSTSSMKPMMSSGQGTDAAAAKGTFSGENGGIIKAYGNIFDTEGKGTNNLRTYKEYGQSSDCYEVQNRNEQVPSSVTTVKGGTTYNNFDTASDFYKYTVETAEQAKKTCMEYSGRLEGGDFKWTFNNEVDDPSHDINAELKAKIVAYKSSIVKIGK